jgi:hypothetical protein
VHHFHVSAMELNSVQARLGAISFAAKANRSWRQGQQLTRLRRRNAAASAAADILQRHEG